MNRFIRCIQIDAIVVANYFQMWMCSPIVGNFLIAPFAPIVFQVLPRICIQIDYFKV